MRRPHGAGGHHAGDAAAKLFDMGVLLTWTSSPHVLEHDVTVTRESVSCVSATAPARKPQFGSRHFGDFKTKKLRLLQSSLQLLLEDGWEGVAA